jgi:hypothetical protein
VPDLSFVFAQSLSGLTAAMFLFLIASGLSLIFGVLRVLNFAHGSFYMLGAYAAYQFVQWLGPGPGRFWGAALGAALSIAALGGVVERLLFRHLYGKEELYHLLFTYALVLILSDVAKIIWGTQQKSVSRPPELTGSFSLALLRHVEVCAKGLHDAVPDGRLGVERRERVLEHHLHVLAHGAHLFAVELRDVGAVERDHTRGRFRQADDQPAERGFARARLTDEPKS